MKIKRLPFKQFKQIYSTVPRLCVEVILLNKDKELLLIRRTIKPHSGKWHTPGGTVLRGESLTDTVKRVAHEELGIKVKVGKQLGIIEYESLKYHYSQDISVAFLVEQVGSQTFDLDGHADKFGWFKKIPTNTIPEQKRFLNPLLFAKNRVN